MEATPEQTAEGLAIVRVLSAVLDRLVIANAPIARADPGHVTKFHAMKAPGISIQQYLERIHKYASCSNECFILALIYIDRLIQRNNFLLTELNVHRVVITAVILAAKFFDDAYYNNAYYAKVGGVLVSEMNGLEVDFLFRINFSLHVTPEVFDKYRAELLSQITSNAAALVLQQQTQMNLSPVHTAQANQSQQLIFQQQQQQQQQIFQQQQLFQQQQQLFQQQQQQQQLVQAAPVCAPSQAPLAPPATTFHPTFHTDDAMIIPQQISPSPPGAARILEETLQQVCNQSSPADMINAALTSIAVDLLQQQDEAYQAVQRAHSMPAILKAAVDYSNRSQFLSQSRCSQQNATFSAPMVPMMAPEPFHCQYSIGLGKTLEEQYLLENNFYPYQSSMGFRHGVGGFHQPIEGSAYLTGTAVGGQRLGSNLLHHHLLASVSGVGM